MQQTPHTQVIESTTLTFNISTPITDTRATPSQLTTASEWVCTETRQQVK